MPNSIFVPLSRMPSGIDEVHLILKNAFSDFDLSLPEVSIENNGVATASLASGFILIDGGGSRQCWVSLNEIDAELSENSDFLILADVKN